METASRYGWLGECAFTVVGRAPTPSPEMVGLVIVLVAVAAVLIFRKP